MGILNTKQEAQDRIAIFRNRNPYFEWLSPILVPLHDYQFSLQKFVELSKIKCQTLISKWDIQLITHLSAYDVKR